MVKKKVHFEFTNLIEWVPIDAFLFQECLSREGNDCFLDACVLYLPECLDSSLVPKIKKIINSIELFLFQDSLMNQMMNQLLVFLKLVEKLSIFILKQIFIQINEYS